MSSHEITAGCKRLAGRRILTGPKEINETWVIRNPRVSCGRTGSWDINCNDRVLRGLKGVPL